jgi:RNA polymerase sigma-70 factor (ECF subfamily)
MDEQTLILAAQRGDLEAFNGLVLHYQDYLFRIALTILHDEDAAADAAQQALLSAFRNLCRFRGGSLRSWLCRIVANACYDELRRLSRSKNIPLQMNNEDGEEIGPALWLADPALSPEEQAETNDLLNAVRATLETLPRHYRLVTQLVDMEGLSYEEAAAALHIPKGTIKSRLARARNSLRLELQRRHGLLPSSEFIDFSYSAKAC